MSATRFLLEQPWGALALSLALRIVYYLQIRGNPYFLSPVMDEGYHDLWAREIAEGDWTSRVPFFRAPLYPFLLGLAYRLLGEDALPLVRAGQLALGAITPVLVWLLARHLFPEHPKRAGACALVSALDGVLLYFEADLLLESVLAPLGTALLLAVVRAGESGHRLRWLAAGAMTGLFAITRPNVLLAVPLFLVLALGWRREGFRLRRPGWGRAGAYALGTCLLVLPVTAANRVVGGETVLVSTQGGLNFFLGNNPESDGWSATARSLFRTDWWGGYEDAIRRAEEGAGRKLSATGVSRYWAGRALEWWRDHPEDALRHLLRKVTLFFSGQELANNRDVRLFFREFAPMGLPFLIYLHVVTPLAVVGSVLLWRRGDLSARAVVLFCSVYAAGVVLFFVTARYRVPIRPALAILAVAGGCGIRDGFHHGGIRGLTILAGAVAVWVFGNAWPWVRGYDPNPALFYQSVANVRVKQDDLPEALRWQKRALGVDPAFPKGNLNLGTMYLQSGDPEAALAAFRRERALDPGDAENLASLAGALQRLGRLDEAVSAYEAAEAAGMEDAPVLYNHALLLERLERPLPEAESLYRRATEKDPSFADAWNNLGIALARRDRLDEAIAAWERGLLASPDHPRLRENLEEARRRNR